MKKIFDLLEKFKSFKNPLEDKNVIASIILKNTNIKLNTDCISFKKDKILIQAHPAIRSSIYTRKQEILKELEGELKGRIFTDIQ